MFKLILSLRYHLTHVDQKKRELIWAVDEYKEQYGVDPGPLIQTDYMSEEVSGLDTGTEEQKAAHLGLMRRAANITESDVDNGVSVFERRKIGFLSKAVSHILSKERQQY